MTAIKKALTEAGLDGQTAHLEARKGSRHQARDYCLKDPQAEWTHEHGTLPEKRQGARSDLEAAQESIRAGLTTLEMMETHPLEMAKYGSHLKEYRELLRDKEVMEAKENLYKDCTLWPWQKDALVHLKCMAPAMHQGV